MNDVVRSSLRRLAKDALCASSSKLNWARRRKAILRISTVCQLNLAGEPFCLGRTSAGTKARRLVHSRSFSVESPVSCDATGVVTKRRLPSSKTDLHQPWVKIGYYTRSSA